MLFRSLSPDPRIRQPRAASREPPTASRQQASPELSIPQYPRPVWARDGSELYYWTTGRTSVTIKAIRITSGPPSSWDAPRVILEGPFATTSRDTEYDVWDGRFLLMKDFTAGGLQHGREIVVVQNLTDEIGRLAPAK